MTDGYRCANCGEIGIGCEPIPATGEHRAVKVEGYAATCVATGLTDGEICGDCETVLKEQTVIPLADHKTETTTVLEPTWRLRRRKAGKVHRLRQGHQADKRQGTGP